MELLKSRKLSEKRIEKAHEKGLEVARKKRVMFAILGDFLGCPSFFVWNLFQINQGWTFGLHKWLECDPGLRA